MFAIQCDLLQNVPLIQCDADHNNSNNNNKCLGATDI